ncbi:hypothetical protein AAHH80_37010, partial [Burkholderia pseudomallei]
PMTESENYTTTNNTYITDTCKNPHSHRPTTTPASTNKHNSTTNANTHTDISKLAPTQQIPQKPTTLTNTYPSSPPRFT